MDVDEYIELIQRKVGRDMEKAFPKSQKVKFISLYVRFKNTQAGNSEKTMRLSKPTALCSHTLKNTQGHKLNDEK